MLGQVLLSLLLSLLLRIGVSQFTTQFTTLFACPLFSVRTSASQCTTQFACFTSTKVHVLTQVEDSWNRSILNGRALKYLSGTKISNLRY